MKLLQCGTYRLDTATPLLMGVVNITPDSFSDGGAFFTVDAALRHAHELVEQGADLIDLGAESSRPGALALDAEEELRRLLPVLHALRDCPVPLSVDTYKPVVMQAALDSGASMINDIYGLRMPGALEVIAASNCAVCIMHMQRDPQTMQNAPSYDDVVGEVRQFLAARLAELNRQGIGLQRVVIDPGFGFGKTLEQNYTLLGALQTFTQFNVPVLVGLSRKSMLGGVTGQAVDERLGSSVAAALAAYARGAGILRVHDVGQTRAALKIWQAIALCEISSESKA